MTFVSFVIILLLSVWLASCDVPRSCSQSSAGWVCAEALSDRIIRIQSSGSIPMPASSQAQFTTLQVDPAAAFPGPSAYTRTPTGLSLPSATLSLSAMSATVVWKGANPVTVTATPAGLAGQGEGNVRSLGLFITPTVLKTINYCVPIYHHSFLQLPIININKIIFLFQC